VAGNVPDTAVAPDTAIAPDVAVARLARPMAGHPLEV
jgi:hypothetical protein